MCVDYPVINYTVAVMVPGQNESLFDNTSSNTDVSISGLVADSRYLFTVVATNVVGTSNASAPVEIRE